MLAKRSQSDTWSEVNKFSSRIESLASPRAAVSEVGTACYDRVIDRSDDLVRTVEKLEGFRKDLAEILKKVPDYVDQVGTVIIDPDGVVGLEMYDHPDSWKAFSKSIMRSFSEELAKEDKTGIFKPDMEATLALVRGFLGEIEKFDEEEVFSKGKGRTVILKTKGYVGEYTTLDGRTIHLLVTKGETEEPFVKRSGPTMRQPESRQPSTIQRFVNWGKRKMGKGTQVVESLRESPKTWTSIRSEVRMSKATLSSRLKELRESGVVEKSKGTNGVTRYSLTGIGQETLHEVEPLNAQINRSISQLKFCMPTVSETKASDLEAEEACPICGSSNVSVWGFDRSETTYQCNDCRHKWNTPRE
jgi:DNA-binding HxlR family transcriptional regulator